MRTIVKIRLQMLLVLLATASTDASWFTAYFTAYGKEATAKVDEPLTQSLTQPLTLAKLKAHYAKPRDFKAEILEVKTAPYLLEPLEQRIAMSRRGSLLEWNAGDQQLVMEMREGKVVSLKRKAGGKLEPVRFDAGSERLKSVLELTSALAGQSFDYFESHFTLSFEAPESRLILTPKPGNFPELTRIVIRFKADLGIGGLQIEGKREQTEFRFLSMTFL